MMALFAGLPALEELSGVWMRPVWNLEPGIRSSYSDRTSGCCAGSWQLRMLPVPDARPFMPLCLTSRHGEFLRQTGAPTAHLKEIMPVTGRVSTGPSPGGSSLLHGELSGRKPLVARRTGPEHAP